MFKGRYKLKNPDKRHASEDLGKKLDFQRRNNRRSVIMRILSDQKINNSSKIIDFDKKKPTNSSQMELMTKIRDSSSNKSLKSKHKLRPLNLMQSRCNQSAVQVKFMPSSIRISSNVLDRNELQQCQLQQLFYRQVIIMQQFKSLQKIIR